MCNPYGGYDEGSPQINSAGCVVWVGNDGSDPEIFMHDGASVTQISNNSYSDFSPHINDDGHVVWYGECEIYGILDFELYLYDGTSTTNISNSHYLDDIHPQINFEGDIVWYSFDPSGILGGAIYLDCKGRNEN